MSLEVVVRCDTCQLLLWHSSALDPTDAAALAAAMEGEEHVCPACGIRAAEVTS